MAVKVADVSSPPAQLLEHFERRGLTKVADVLLVGDTEYEHACATHGSTDGIERKRYLVYDVARHGIVDLARRLDKLQVDIVLLGFPRQVEGIDGDAVPPDARPWVERHEAIWLGLGSFDDLPDILSLIHISEPTRLGMISYAVFCLKKKKKHKNSGRCVHHNHNENVENNEYTAKH